LGARSGLHARGDFLQRPLAGDPAQQSLSGIVFDERAGLLLIDLETLGDHVLTVVRPLVELGAVAAALVHPGRQAMDVVYSVAFRTDAPPGEALHQRLPADV